MLIVTYDISNNKVRTKFGKFLKRFGRRIQYSVFEIRNSDRILNLILTEIEEKYAKTFGGGDSILVIPISKADKGKVKRYGYPAMEEEEILFL